MKFFYLFGKIWVISKILYFNWSTVSLDWNCIKGSSELFHLILIEYVSVCVLFWFVFNDELFSVIVVMKRIFSVRLKNLLPFAFLTKAHVTSLSLAFCINRNYVTTFYDKEFIFFHLRSFKSESLSIFVHKC